MFLQELNQDWYNTDERGNVIHACATIYANVKMGKGNIIEAGAVIGSPGALRGVDMAAYKGYVVIGDNNHFYANCVVACGEAGPTSIGDNNLLMNGCNIGHNTYIGNNNEIGANTVIPGHCDIDDGVKIKSNCTLKTFTKICAGAIVGQHSNVTMDIASPGLYYGNPAKFVRKEYVKA